MALQRGSDGGAGARSEPAAGLARAGEIRYDTRVRRLATGTLACPSCDVPVAIGQRPMAPAQPLACPYCGHAAALRDFLSLAAPSRPARVAVRVRPRTRP